VAASGSTIKSTSNAYTGSTAALDPNRGEGYVVVTKL
jgi:hypothetical protein